MDLQSEKRAEALQILCSIAERTRSKAGCLGCAVFQSIEHDSQILVDQFWRSNEELLSHLRSEDYQKLLLIIEMSSKMPEVRFDTITNMSGMETIEKARRQKRSKANINY
jgi:quinol monooxygenase YgiN